MNPNGKQEPRLLIGLVSLALLCVGALALSACCDGGLGARYNENWECEDLCDWTPSGVGFATPVNTIHPGEHGVLLEGQVQISAVVRVPYNINGNRIQRVTLISDCRDNLTLTMAEGAINTTQEAYQFSLEPLTDTDEGTLQILSVELDDTLFSQSNPATMEFSELSISQPSGTCFVDELVLWESVDECGRDFD